MPSQTAQNFLPKVQTALILMLLAVAIMRLVMVFVHEANWDEYLNLSMIYDHQRGELREILQTGFVHIFGWVTWVSGNEADQIIAARLVYFGVGILTSAAIWKTARALVSTEGAFFVILCYWGFSYNFVHGVSLRTDPLAASAMMCALCLVISGNPSTRRALAAGVLVGLAGFFTIKAIFYVPALAAITLIRWAKVGSMVKGAGTTLLIGIVALLSFVGLSFGHAMTFHNVASPFEFLGRTADSTLAPQNYMILIQYLRDAFMQNLVFVALWLFGFFGLVIRLRDPVSRTEGLLGLALVTPLLSAFVYRDTYPYYYPFILAPVMVIVGFAWDDLRRRYSAKIAVTVAAVACLCTLVVTIEYVQKPIDRQRTTLDVIHRIFPDEPSYIDGRSMVSSFSKRGPFMSTWGMTDYRRDGRPIMAELIERHQPQFLLANTWHLQLDRMSPAQSESRALGLLSADMALLQDNYTRFWGPLYLPGKTIEVEDDSINILISGTYRLIAEAPVVIDGNSLRPNGVIQLDATEYSVAATTSSQLIFDVERPSEPSSEDGLFSSF
ncbi:hypothetical protein MWU60_17685 [Yoonia sp. F2084L]|uniref:hypothetical protein n=1 Tax=Yoonia sp. F2084L TaxID=2926419 RepID=UPI001FF50503|nr:hypothetical protein [Yoonia sp. F2084L]MCK0097413.1 hypothetical protein [Yoonia sp. F2084L]